MGIRAVFAAADAIFMPLIGEDAVFTPAAGAAIPCKIFIDFSVLLQPAGVEAHIWERGTTIEALLSEIGREPKRGETFEYDSVVYTVKSILENDGLTVKAVVT
jgi:hypothetical protein